MAKEIVSPKIKLVVIAGEHILTYDPEKRTLTVTADLEQVAKDMLKSADPVDAIRAFISHEANQ
jgi:hypothetical protein